jgi:hypothetical protein
MRQISTIQWLVRCAATAALLLLACRIATAWIGSGLQQPAVTARDGSLNTFNRYVAEPKPDLVLVGSSVTWRLKEEYFAPAKVRNLALAGGSSLTGLAIVAAQKELPKITLIEANILSRGIDAAMVERFSGGGDASPAFFRPVRMAVAAFEMWNHAPPDAAHSAAAREALLARPADDFDNRISLDRALHENTYDPSAAVRDSVDRIRPLIEAIERRGSRALLIEVPFQPAMAKSTSATVTRQIMAAAFPRQDQWLRIEPPAAELRWADGVHLDERSAALVARAIEQALAARGLK